MLSEVHVAQCSEQLQSRLHARRECWATAWRRALWGLSEGQMPQTQCEPLWRLLILLYTDGKCCNWFASQYFSDIGHIFVCLFRFMQFVVRQVVRNWKRTMDWCLSNCWLWHKLESI
jgi:hypothetical protein